MRKIDASVLADGHRKMWRAWDGEKYVPFAKLTQDGEMIDYYEAGTTDPRHWVFEACTGIMDIEGELIYESDIVTVQDFVHSTGIIPKEKIIKKACVVKYSTGLGAYIIERAGDIGDHFWLFGDSIDIKLLGNIHKNPELLKGDDTYVWDFQHDTIINKRDYTDSFFKP